MQTAAELRARLEAAQAEHEAARAEYEAWNPPPMEPDATPEEYEAYGRVRDAARDAFVRREDAWFELDDRRSRTGRWLRTRVAGIRQRRQEKGGAR